MRQKALKKEDFDIVTKSNESPNKRNKNFKDKMQKPYQPKEGEELIPSDFASHIVKTALKQSKDPFKLLGVSSQDKMTFFLLKWVFNAIKLDSDP